MAEPASTERHLHRVAEDLLAYGLLSGLTQVSGLVLLPILTRALSVDEYGAVDVVAAGVAFLSVLLQVALPSALARHFGDDPERQASLISTLLVFLVALGAGVVLCVHALAEPLARLLLGASEAAAFLRLGAWVAWLASLLAVLDTVLRMQRRIVAFNLLQLARTVAYVGLAVVLVVQRGEGVRGVFTAQLLANGLVLVASLALTRRQLTRRVSGECLRTLLGFGAPMLPGQLVLWVNSQADRLLLLAFVGLAGVGVFGVAARVAMGVQFLLLVFRQAWQPHAMRLIDDPARAEVYRRMLGYFGAGFAVLCLWLSALGPELFAVVVPAEFRGSYVVLPWLLGAAVLHHSANLTNLGLVATGATAGISGASFAAVGLNVALALLLIPSFGIAGAALGAFVSELAFTTLLLRMSARRTELRFDTRGALAILVAYVLACTAMLVAWQALDGGASLAVRVALAVVASVVAATSGLRRVQ